MYPEKFIRDNVVAPYMWHFGLQLSHRLKTQYLLQHRSNCCFTMQVSWCPDCLFRLHQKTWTGATICLPKWTGGTMPQTVQHMLSV